jgi:hypothetical protein
VAGPLRGHAQAALGGVADGLDHVVRIGYAYDRGGALIMSEVEGLAGGVPGLVALGDDRAVDAGLKFSEAT